MLLSRPELLEFIRNLAVVSAIKFFAARADSFALHAVAEVGTFVGVFVAQRGRAPSGATRSGDSHPI
jgi:hypothetical protein